MYGMGSLGMGKFAELSIAKPSLRPIYNAKRIPITVPKRLQMGKTAKFQIPHDKPWETDVGMGIKDIPVVRDAIVESVALIDTYTGLSVI